MAFAQQQQQRLAGHHTCSATGPCHTLGRSVGAQRVSWHSRCDGGPRCGPPVHYRRHYLLTAARTAAGASARPAPSRRPQQVGLGPTVDSGPRHRSFAPAECLTAPPPPLLQPAIGSAPRRPRLAPPPPTPAAAAPHLAFPAPLPPRILLRTTRVTQRSSLTPASARRSWRASRRRPRSAWTGSCSRAAAAGPPALAPALAPPPAPAGGSWSSRSASRRRPCCCRRAWWRGRPRWVTLSGGGAPGRLPRLPVATTARLRPGGRGRWGGGSGRRTGAPCCARAVLSTHTAAGLLQAAGAAFASGSCVSEPAKQMPTRQMDSRGCVWLLLLSYPPPPFPRGRCGCCCWLR
jgi:hypothetical protein